MDAVVRVLSGNVDIKNDVLCLERINSRVSSMPVFVNGKISNIYNNPNLNLSISSKLTQQFFDRFFNEKSVYPVKTKGNINFYTTVHRAFDTTSNKSRLNLDESRSVNWIGAEIPGEQLGTVSG